MGSATQGGCRSTETHLVAVLHEEEQVVLVGGARCAARHKEKLHSRGGISPSGLGWHAIN